MEDPRRATDLGKQVRRLIKNKMEPLAFKFHVFKSGGSPSQLINQKENDHRQMQQLPKIVRKRRKAVVSKNQIDDRLYYQALQRKVEKHIALRRVTMAENRYAHAQECHPKQKKQISRQISNSPLSPYLKIFQQAERPSEKIRRIEEKSCDSMLKQIQGAKTLKNIQCVEQSAKGLWNADKKPEREHKQQSQKQKKKTDERRLKKNILKDIKEYCQSLGSSKIRININHQKMILIK